MVSPLTQLLEQAENGPAPRTAIYEWLDDNGEEAVRLLTDMAALLGRLDAWDHMHTAADGRYWREDEIAPLLARFAALEERAAQLNAIERLRADHIDSGIALGHIDTEDCLPTCVVCAALAAVDALYQAAKDALAGVERDMPEWLAPPSPEDFGDDFLYLVALAAAVRRVEGE